MHIGLFFGSFNPIHVGHLSIAGYMAQFTALDQVWFVVSPHNPLKEKKSLLKGHHRLAMVNAAIDDILYLRATDIEFSLPQPSYTVNTLVHLSEKYPQHKFSLIMGSDNLQSLDKWKNYEVLLENHSIFVYPRPGFSESTFNKHPSVIITEAPQMDVSSTFIREAIALQKDVKCFMPFEAWKYLDEMNFYKI